MSSAQKELRPGEETSLKTMWFVTHLGARYEVPDMLREHITTAHAQLGEPAGSIDHADNVVATNISDVVLLLPKRIIHKAGVGDRCFWESE